MKFLTATLFIIASFPAFGGHCHDGHVEKTFVKADNSEQAIHYNANGQSYTKVGDTTHSSSGVTYTKKGNVIVDSKGNRYVKGPNNTWVLEK